MKVVAAVIFLLLGITCIFGAVDAFQMSQELSLQALRMEWDLMNFDLDAYRAVVRKETSYGNLFMLCIAGIILSFGSGGALLIKEP